MTPEQMLEHDQVRWPNAEMAGYIRWISEKWNEYLKLKNIVWVGCNEKEHAEFDEWLESPSCQTIQ